MVERGLVSLDFVLAAELFSVRRLVTRYRDRPMSLADTCLVRKAELYDEAAVLTLDADFTIYRKNGRQIIPVVAPSSLLFTCHVSSFSSPSSSSSSSGFFFSSSSSSSSS